MNDAKYSVLLMRDDTSVKRYRVSPVWLRLVIIGCVVLVLLSVGGTFAGVKFWMNSVALSKEKKVLQISLHEAEQQVERLKNVQNLQFEEREEIDSLASTVGLDANKNMVVPIDLKEVFNSINLHQIGVDNFQARMTSEKIRVSCEINNLQTTGSISGDIIFSVVTNDGAIIETLSNRNDLSFEIQRFKRIRTSFPYPEQVSREKIFALRIKIDDQTGTTVFSETYPLDKILL